MGYGLGACLCWPCPLPTWPPPGATGNVVLAQPPPHLLDQQGRGGSWALGRALVGPAAAGGILGQRPGRAGPPGLGRGGLCPRALLQVHRSRDPREAGGSGPRGNPLSSQEPQPRPTGRGVLGSGPPAVGRRSLPPTCSERPRARPGTWWGPGAAWGLGVALGVSRPLRFSTRGSLRGAVGAAGKQGVSWVSQPHPETLGLGKAPWGLHTC